MNLFYCISICTILWLWYFNWWLI